MVTPGLLYSVATLILSTSLGVGFALACWRWASASTRRAKPPPSEPATPISGRVTALEGDLAALYSSQEKILASLKSLTSRQAVRDHRAREKSESSDRDIPPPLGTPKAELLKHYGMAGKVGPAFAQAQLEMEYTRGEPN